MTDFEIGLYVAKLEQRMEKQEQEQKKNSKRIQELEQIILEIKGKKAHIDIEQTPSQDQETATEPQEPTTETPIITLTPVQEDTTPRITDQDVAKLQKIMARDSINSRILRTLMDKGEQCLHELEKPIKTLLPTLTVQMRTLEKLGFVYKSAKKPCKVLERRHQFYSIKNPKLYLFVMDRLNTKQGEKTIPVIPAKKKIAITGMVHKNSTPAKILQFIQDNGETCIHDIQKKFPNININTIGSSITYLLKGGRIKPTDKKMLCKYSTRIHTRWVTTIEITPESFVDIKNEEKAIADKRYLDELADKTKILDVNSRDPTGFYIYKDILETMIMLHKDKKLEWIYASYIGKKAPSRRGKDKNWTKINECLDRLEQDHLVTHGYKSVAGSKWKLTQRGSKVALGLEIDDMGE